MISLSKKFNAQQSCVPATALSSQPFYVFAVGVLEAWTKRLGSLDWLYPNPSKANKNCAPLPVPTKTVVPHPSLATENVVPHWPLATKTRVPHQPMWHWILGCSWGRVGSLLGPSWGCLGSVLTPSWRRLGPSWVRLGVSWELLECILAHLGRRQTASWGVRRRLGARLLEIWD